MGGTSSATARSTRTPLPLSHRFGQAAQAVACPYAQGRTLRRIVWQHYRLFLFYSSFIGFTFLEISCNNAVKNYRPRCMRSRSIRLGWRKRDRGSGRPSNRGRPNGRGLTPWLSTWQVLASRWVVQCHQSCSLLHRLTHTHLTHT
jgi:hypothetical protein